MLMRFIVFCLVLNGSARGQEPVPDFSLRDKNESSPRTGELISPRDYRHQVTAYYFGDSS